MKATKLLLLTALLGLVLPSLFAAERPGETRDEKVIRDRKEVSDAGAWIYNDLERGLEDAKSSGKPLLVVLRCIPCQACFMFDEQVVHLDDRVKPLMDKFVRVRLVQANGLDLALFQYDYDLSFAAFFMNADKTIYGRFGTRSSLKDPTRDISMEGFGKAMEAALALHKGYPANKQMLSGKVGPAPRVAHPEDYPSLKGKYTPKLVYESKVAQSCIHCHQVREADREARRSNGENLTERSLFPYPMPDVLGMHLSPTECATVESVAGGTPAHKAGLKAGDKISTIKNQPILSIADAQFVLEQEEGALDLPLKVRRDATEMNLRLKADAGWRRNGDISWRATTWELRRLASGGLVMEDVPDSERASLGLAPNAFALRVTYVGQYGSHALGKKSGFQKDDILTSVDGAVARQSEGQFLATQVQSHRAGEPRKFKVLRAGQVQELSMPMQ